MHRQPSTVCGVAKAKLNIAALAYTPSYIFLSCSPFVPCRVGAAGAAVGILATSMSSSCTGYKVPGALFILPRGADNPSQPSSPPPPSYSATGTLLPVRSFRPFCAGAGSVETPA